MYKIFYSWLFYFMAVHFIFLCCLVFANLKYLREQFKKIDKKVWLALVLIFLFGFFLRNSEYWLGPHTDGYVAQESAHMWVLHGDFVKSCALGNQESCEIFEQVLSPPGFPFIIALSHLIFGINSLNASVISAVLSSLTIILSFLIAYLIFRKEEIGLYAAMIFSLIPINIINSQTGLSRPTGLFFVALAVLFFLLAIKNNKLVTWLAMAVCLSYSIYVRQESCILVGLFFVFTIIYKWDFIKDYFYKLFFTRKIKYRIIVNIFIIFIIFSILQIPFLNWMINDNPYNSYQGGGFFALHYKGILIQGGALIQQFVNSSPVGYNIFHYNTISSLLFFLGIIFLLLKPSKNKIFILGLFFSYFIVYSLMFDGNIQGTGRLTGDYFRRSIMFCLPYSIVAGYAVFCLLPSKRWKQTLITLFIILFLILTVNVSFNRNFKSNNFKTFTQNINFYFPLKIFYDARAEKTGDGSLIYPNISYWIAVGKIPDDSLVITSQHILITNDYFKNNHREAAQIDLINQHTINLFVKKIANTNCVIYFEDYRCDDNYQDGQDYACQFLENNLEKEFLFQEGSIGVFKVKLKNSS